MIWYYSMVPASQRALLTLGIDTINSGTFSVVTRMALIIIVTSATIVGVAYFLAYRNPIEFNLSHALSVLLLALMATGAGEYSREMLRKPFVIGRWMYSNGVRVPSVSKVNTNGYLAESNWVWNGSRVRLLAWRGDLPRRVWIVSHAGWLPSASSIARRTRPRQHRKLHRHAA